MILLNCLLSSQMEASRLISASTSLPVFSKNSMKMYNTVFINGHLTSVDHGTYGSICRTYFVGLAEFVDALLSLPWAI